MKRKRTYSWVDVMMASPDRPLPDSKRLHQLTVMWQGLRSIEQDPEPTTNDWRVCSDAVNLMETLVVTGHVQDSAGLIADAVAAMAEAGKRHLNGHPIRLTSRGIMAVRAVLEDYATALSTLSARTMIQCHMTTERRIHEMLDGRRKPHDVEVMDL